MPQKQLEALLWSIAFPGFGQILNGHIIKGILFVTLEVIINVFSNFNKAIVLSFNGEIHKAIEVADYQWLMFYPCIYMFAIWDAYRHSQKDRPRLSFLPFVFSAYFVTVGLIYSSTLKLSGVLFGPIWLPMLFLIPGLGVGFLLRKLIITFTLDKDGH